MSVKFMAIPPSRHKGRFKLKDLELLYIKVWKKVKNVEKSFYHDIFFALMSPGLNNLYTGLYFS